MDLIHRAISLVRSYYLDSEVSVINGGKWPVEFIVPPNEEILARLTKEVSHQGYVVVLYLNDDVWRIGLVWAAQETVHAAAIEVLTKAYSETTDPVYKQQLGTALNLLLTDPQSTIDHVRIDERTKG